MAITRPRVKGILESILDSEVEGSRDGSVVEFCSYYLGVVDGMTDNMPPMQVTSCLYLNPKVAHESGAEWVDGESRTDKAHRLVYSSAFNHARDVVRRALEQAVLIDGAREGEVYDGGDWDHLEVFPTCEMMSRRKEEGAKESHIRHLRERTVPEMDLFLRVAGSKTELEFLQAVDGLDEEILLLLEALLSAYKEDHLLQEGLGCCPLRKDLIRWLRAVRWGDIDASSGRKCLAL